MQQYDDSRYSRRPEESDMVTVVQIMCSARIELDMISMCPELDAIDIELALVFVADSTIIDVLLRHRKIIDCISFNPSLFFTASNIK